MGRVAMVQARSAAGLLRYYRRRGDWNLGGDESGDSMARVSDWATGPFGPYC